LLPCWLAASLVVLGCGPELEPGVYGNFRYVGNVRGATPLRLMPPRSDRDGNAYVLYGALADPAEVSLFIGNVGGGWKSCTGITQGAQFGLHGFVGRAQSSAWYWSGEALVAATGRGNCSRVLETDPASGARLNFRAVVPWVRETPSRTSSLAWIQSPTDPVPFQVVLDLDNEVYSAIDGFEPSDATEVAILGVGGNVDRGEGVIVVRYRRGDALFVEARFIDSEGETFEEVGIGGLETLPEYGITGFLESDDTGLYAAIDVEGQLVLIDTSGGRRVGVGGMVPIGVHRWEGQLYMVGDAGGRPAIAHIDGDGDVGDVEIWESSLDAIDELGSEIDLIDDRSLPSKKITWGGPRTAMSAFPFVHPHGLDHYTDGVTTWLIAGPSFSVGGEDFTAIAWAPVGIAYAEDP
jgi:hypothetical protein